MGSRIEMMKASLSRFSEFPDALDYPGLEKDDSYRDDYPTVSRCFGFVDVSGYTAFTHQHGTHAAAQMLLEFRRVVRRAVGRRGVRVAKWLGDGVMLVSERVAPLVAAVAEINCVYAEKAFSVHSGICYGPVIIFEGDDFIGKPVNAAAKLMEKAEPGEVLALNVHTEDLPEWIVATLPTREIILRGLGEVENIYQLSVKPD